MIKALSLILCLVAAPCALYAGDLSFKTNEIGHFSFDTGVVKGTMQKDGRGEALVLRFNEGDIRIDKNHGLLAPYRFLTSEKRYGPGAGSWEWPRVGAVLPNGTAQLWWNQTPDRPFEFSTVYEWKTPDTLDFTVFFYAKTNLNKFELFLGSYFERFIKAMAYLQDGPTGQAGFVEITGPSDLQSVPRDPEALNIIDEGRLRFPPNPLNSTTRGSFAAPIVMKIEPKSGATVLIMAPPEDCFALTMWRQDHPNQGVYLRLFGKDVRQNQTLVGHARLVFGKNLTEAQALQRYAAYRKENLLATAPAETASLRAAAENQFHGSAALSWINPMMPKPNKDGWITLFDGQHLFGCDPTDQNFTSGKVFLNDGSLRMDNAHVRFDWKAHNTALRVRGKKVSGRNITLAIGPYRGWFNGKAVCFGIHKVINGRVAKDLAVKSAAPLPDFFDMEMTVIGGKITLMANGATVVTAQDDPIAGDVSLSVMAWEGLGVFKKIEAKVLDDRAQTSEATVIPKDASWISPEVPRPNADGWIKLFDGKRLYAVATVSDADLRADKVSVQDGILKVDSTALRFAVTGENMTVRTVLRNAAGQSCGLSLRGGEGRDYMGWYNGGDSFGIQLREQTWKNLVNGRSSKRYEEFFEMQFGVEDQRLTVSAEGQPVCTFRESTLKKGDFVISTRRGPTFFRSIEIRVTR